MFFFELDADIRRKYSGLFQTIGFEPKEGTSITNEPYVKTPIEDFNERYSWYMAIRNLAQGDLTKFDQITELNLFLVLNELSYQKELDNFEKQLERINELKRQSKY